MSLKKIAVSVEREVRGSDGAGGKTRSWTRILSNLTATKNYYSSASLLRLEQADHNAAGPGVQTRTLQLFTFRPPFPIGIQREDRIYGADGKRWSVRFIRGYDTTLQIDTELVE